MRPTAVCAAFLGLGLLLPAPCARSDTDKPVLHGRHWIAITGKPLAATAGAKMFDRGGNAIDAACAMLAVVCTMFDDVSWGGETQALIFDPRHQRVVGINALGVAPSGATPAFFRQKGMQYPPPDGPLAAVTPGNPGARQSSMPAASSIARMSPRNSFAAPASRADSSPSTTSPNGRSRSKNRSAPRIAAWRSASSPAGPKGPSCSRP